MNTKSPIRKGDELEHGGEVTSCSPWTNLMGRPLARKGDAALCVRHGPTLILFAISLASAHAQVVNSCDGAYSAKVIGRGEIFVGRAGKNIGVAKINHDVAGGVFDLAGRLLVVYGVPNRVDLRSPQAEFLSIYTLKPKLRLIMRRTYGGGIYDAAIGFNQNLIFVSNRFGFDIVDIKTMEIKSFDPLSEPPFSRQQCENGLTNFGAS
ncbi:PAAR domain-containing protein [Paraburkholderia sp. FT54]|uniref:PAAR domain-containing protein n=1 Tax=Paraburkholderia sp. FT54 TaxID=3074437 RepID=UPI0028775CA0|nr:PAAR domain-containing protein [Paraburkholderia sp. FT54]WNC89831.1 PAAR domain-containing protein [Paraburkholderia sp. FT54]